MQPPWRYSMAQESEPIPMLRAGFSNWSSLHTKPSGASQTSQHRVSGSPTPNKTHDIIHFASLAIMLPLIQYFNINWTKALKPEHWSHESNTPVFPLLPTRTLSFWCPTGTLDSEHLWKNWLLLSLSTVVPVHLASSCKELTSLKFSK